MERQGALGRELVSALGRTGGGCIVAPDFEQGAGLIELHGLGFRVAVWRTRPCWCVGCCLAVRALDGVTGGQRDNFVLAIFGQDGLSWKHPTTKKAGGRS